MHDAARFIDPGTGARGSESSTIVRRMRLFYSYSSLDEAFRRELEAHLSLLKREGVLDAWSFRDIEAGNDWQQKIDIHLDSADLTLLLVSPQFIASRYCWEIEMTRAVERAARRQTILVPIIIRPCDWRTAPFARFQALPENAKPISLWRPRDLGWANVASGLRKLIKQDAEVDRLLTTPERTLQQDTNALEYARQIARSMGEHKSRQPEEPENVDEVVAAEAARLYVELRRLVGQINVAAPELPLQIIVDSAKCTVETNEVKLVLNYHHRRLWGHYARYETPERASDPGIVIGLLRMLGNQGLPNYSWMLARADHSQWLWRAVPPAADTRLTSSQLADALIKQVLDLHDDIATGRW